MIRRIANSIAVLLLIAAPVALAQETETIDRIVATVNHQPVLQSEWEDSLRFEGFLQGRLPQNFSADERAKALDRLIDRVLLSQQMQADYSSTPQELADRERDIREQLKGAETDQGWNEMLAKYGLREPQFDTALANQLKVMRFVELRLRPTIRVTRDQITDYYNRTLVPQIEKAGRDPEPLERLTPRIRELLVQKEIDGVLEDWLANLRSQSEIHVTSDGSEIAVPVNGANKDQK